MLTAHVRYDDSCGNGHNSFAITGDVVTPASKRRNGIEAGGMLHEEIERVFPELAPYLKWHLTGSDGPMHYVANTLWHLGYQNAKEPNLEYARSTAVWPDMPETFLASSGKYESADIEDVLVRRQDALLAEFKIAEESLGFTY